MSATVIVKNDRCSGEYDMFDLRSVNLAEDAESAVLHGPLFLEVGETMTLRVGMGSEKVDLQAKVQSVRSADSIMTVRLVDLDKRSRTVLAGLKLADAKSADKKSVDAKSADKKK